MNFLGIGILCIIQVHIINRQLVNYLTALALVSTMSTIQHFTDSYSQPEKVRQLNLSSTIGLKIYEISNLDKFIRLRTLILSNNMIRRISGLSNLTNLRILNLEFNQIRVLQGTQTLTNLQQLYLAYNQIQLITDSILFNTKLNTLHLAFNDIKSLESISVLYRHKEQSIATQQSPTKTIENYSQGPKVFPYSFILSHLNVLSLYGNPIVSSINYLSFFKMLIPSLRIIDDKNVRDYQFIFDGVCPQEEVYILREAINKLLDQRNAAVQELETYATYAQKSINAKSQKKKIKQSEDQLQNYINLDKTIQIHEKNLKINKQIIKYLQSTKKKYTLQIQNYKQKIMILSQRYTENLQRQKQSYSKYTQKVDSNHTEQAEECDYNQQRSMGNACNRQMLRQIKQQQECLNNMQMKIKNINKIIEYIDQRQKVSGNNDIYTFVLQMVLFGYDLNCNLDISNIQKLIKKYLIRSTFHAEQRDIEIKTGLIQYSQILKKIIYGQNLEGTQTKGQLNSILQLKSKIKQKGLLQIVTQIKQSTSRQTLNNKKFESQRQNFIQKFQRETKQLSRSWDELREEKIRWQKHKQRQQEQIETYLKERQRQMKRKYRVVEQQQKLRITQLKSARQKLQNELQSSKLQLCQVQERLNRRFLELEQFQNHFNQFIGQKQHIKCLSDQINEITHSLNQQKQKYNSLNNKIRELTLEQGILENKLQRLEETIKIRGKQLAQIDRRKNQISKAYSKNKQELDAEIERLKDIYNTISNKTQQIKDYEKMIERNRKNYAILQQKLKNIECIQKNKKQAIKELQQHIKCLRQDKQILLLQINSSQKNIQIKRQQVIKIQLKIQENKLTMESLTDINKSVSDMMIRQSQLKRSIIQLEIQNKNLLEMKNNLLEDLKIKQYM